MFIDIIQDLLLKISLKAADNACHSFETKGSHNKQEGQSNSAMMPTAITCLLNLIKFCFGFHSG
jgi:hypothetical protein